MRLYSLDNPNRLIEMEENNNKECDKTSSASHFPDLLLSTISQQQQPSLSLVPTPLQSSSSTSSSSSSSASINVSVSQINSNNPGEDRYVVLIKPTMKGFLVIDGHGGYLAADIAASYVLATLFKSIEKLDPDDKMKPNIISKIIDDTTSSCDDIILKKALEYQAFPNFSHSKDFGRAGACMALILIVEDMLYIANVGDCRAVLLQNNDYCHALGEQHSTVNVKKRSRSADILTNQINEISNVTMTDINNDNNDEMTLDANNEMKRLVEIEKLEDLSDNKENSHDTNSLDFKKFDSLLPDQKNTTHENQSMNANKNQKIRLDVGGEYFSYQLKSLLVKGVTTDHCCSIEAERDLITKNNRDPQPLRQSESDAKLYGARAPMRVAGSLAVTRALGDGYLKMSGLSSAMYKDYVPYITCKPTIHVRKLLSSDICLILASDGLWNYLSAKDSISVIKSDLDEVLVDNCQDSLYLSSHEPQSQSLTRIAGHVPAQGQQLEINKPYTNGLASKLVEKCLCNAAAQYSLPVSELKNMSVGSNRRDYIDDITVITLRLR